MCLGVPILTLHTVFGRWGDAEALNYHYHHLTASGATANLLYPSEWQNQFS